MFYSFVILLEGVILSPSKDNCCSTSNTKQHGLMGKVFAVLPHSYTGNRPQIYDKAVRFAFWLHVCFSFPACLWNNTSGGRKCWYSILALVRSYFLPLLVFLHGKLACSQVFVGTLNCCHCKQICPLS